MNHENPYKAINTVIKPRLQTLLRWQHGHYDNFPRESIWDHTIDCIDYARDLFHRFDGQLTHLVDKEVAYRMLLVHDFGEWKNGDTAVADVNHGQQKRIDEELLAVRELADLHHLPDDVISFATTFENWTATTEHPFESAFARFVDTRCGAVFFLSHQYRQDRIVDNNEYQQDIRVASDRMFRPLKRMYDDLDNRKENASIVFQLASKAMRECVSCFHTGPIDMEEEFRVNFERIFNGPLL